VFDQLPDVTAQRNAISYNFPFEAIAATSVATVETLRKRAPKLPVNDKLLVNALHALFTLNEAEPVVLSTSAPRITFDAEGITTTPVNWFVSPYMIPALTFEVDG
jgi:hypothetical protein